MLWVLVQKTLILNYRDNSRMIFHRLTFLALFSSLTVTLYAAPLVAIDVGHGLTDSGALSARGRSEFEFNREFAGVLAGAVTARGLAVRAVNFDGSVRILADRPRLAGKADFFIAIHHDSISEQYLSFWDWDGSEASYTEVKRGFGLFVSANSPDLATSLRCASSIGSQLRRAGFIPTPWHGRKHLAADADNGVWYYDNLVVLYRTKLPAVLFEAGVIKHREEELELRDPQRQALMADALATGIAGCLFVREKSVQE
jgi:N-acetylmuramoyl-L-alanine amidase